MGRDLSQDDMWQNESKKWRNLYYGGIKFKTEEKSFIELLKQKLEPELKKENLSMPKWWTEADYVRFLGQTSYDLKQAVKFIIGHLQYIQNHKDFVLSEEAADFLRNGGVTIMGRDQKGQPNLMLALGKIPQHTAKNVEILIEALQFALFVIRKYMLVGKYSEKFNFILDFACKPIPTNKAFIKAFEKLFKNNFTSIIDKTVLYRPTKFFAVIWVFILGLGIISERDKMSIEFVDKNKLEGLKKIICEEDMEKLYGGILPDEGQYKGSYWPPRPSMQGEVITDEDIKNDGLKVFNVICKEEDYKIVYPKNKVVFE